MKGSLTSHHFFNILTARHECAGMHSIQCIEHLQFTRNFSLEGDPFALGLIGPLPLKTVRRGETFFESYIYMATSPVNKTSAVI